ncbi:leucine-rich repeat-containing protein 15 [Culex quinquefasciatus]|uniref:leucine-rich repeat-containing protein 15 n=1 Tax=Culex quinquefasciatus TaxID=7176 RepID=UPI0018E2B503|nr:leucine-rich repeat-containing protein 15 [Culex quinquefasciatus]
MNTYLWTAALLACFSALGGLGHELHLVDLCRKNITDANLEDELGKLSTDTLVLELCKNQLENLDPDLFRRFDRLDKLVFDGNPDLGFPPDGSPFLVVKSLTELQCVNCGVEKIFNRSLQDLPKIERINLTNNRITDIEKLAFRENSELQLIDLKQNMLERLPNELIEGLRKLEQLDLSFNQKLNVHGDQPFLYSSTLKELKCEGCGFTVIYEQTFAKLPNLRELILRGNVIVSVQSNAFQPMNNLEKLWLQNNQLVSVYAELLDKNQLQLCLNNNTDQLLCEIQKIESWQKFQCQNESQTEVDCAQFTEPPTEPTTHQTEISVFSSDETSTTTTTTTVTTTTTQVTTTTTRNPPAEPMGISDWYISSYLTIIILTQIGALVILVGVWLKMKKYDSDPELDSLAGTVLNPSSIYKPLY